MLSIVQAGMSDSAVFDMVLELLYICGRSLPHAVMMMIPEAWSKNEFMDSDRKGFYEYHQPRIVLSEDLQESLRRIENKFLERALAISQDLVVNCEDRFNHGCLVHVSLGASLLFAWRRFMTDPAFHLDYSVT